MQNHDIVAGPIDIVPGQNDGWQRIRIHAQGEDVVANFGGTYGFDDGQRFAFTTTTTQPGQVYIAYREAILYNANGTAGTHPPHFDLLDVHVPTTGKTFIGTGSPTTVATPAIDTNGLAIVGSAGFAITGAGLVPQGAPGYAFCGLAVGFSSFPTGYPIAGAPSTVNGYVLPIVASLLGSADATGEVSFPLPLPQNNGLIGVLLSCQLGDLDLAMPFATPVGTSQGMEIVIGN